MSSEEKNILHEPQADYQVNKPADSFTGFVHQSDDERLLQDIIRPDIEKLNLFTKMLRRNATLNKVVVQK